MGRNIPPNRKIIVEKWCYFPEVYQMTKVLEDGMENVNFRLRFLYVNLKILSKKFQSPSVLAQTRKDLPLDFLNIFKIIKDLH